MLRFLRHLTQLQTPTNWAIQRFCFPKMSNRNRTAVMWQVKLTKAGKREVQSQKVFPEKGDQALQQRDLQLKWAVGECGRTEGSPVHSNPNPQLNYNNTVIKVTSKAILWSKKTKYNNFLTVWHNENIWRGQKISLLGGLWWAPRGTNVFSLYAESELPS